MITGDWNLNGQTIKIGKTGRLLDGQHRCAACIKANVTFEAVVISGLDESVFDTFDLGARRGLSDILKDKGETYTATLAASLRQLWMLQNGYVQDRTVSPTVNEMLETLDRNPKMRESVKLSSKILLLRRLVVHFIIYLIKLTLHLRTSLWTGWLMAAIFRQIVQYSN
jgi:hypothetical protein